MALPDVVTREQWLAARTALLAKEKAATRARDALNAERRRLPMVEVSTPYVFEGPSGPAGLLDLFEGRAQLIVEHVMYDPSWSDVCPSCSGRIDNVGRLEHLHARRTTLVAVSRAPYPALAAARTRRGWTLPWYSSHGSTFNHDFGVTVAESDDTYNYAPAPDGELPYEMPGQSYFLRDGDTVFHTYSSYARGTESIGGTHYYLDHTALGRQETWEQPHDRIDGLKPAPGAGDPDVRYADDY